MHSLFSPRSSGVISLILAMLLVWTPLAFAQEEPSAPPEKLEAPKPEPVKGGEYPAAPWVIEGIGIGLFAIGFLSVALAAGQGSERDRLLNTSKTEIAETGVSKVKAADMKAAEDNAMTLQLVGFILGGVGLAAMIVGAVWIISYQPPKEPSARNALPPSVPPMAYGAQPRQVLFSAE